MPQPPTRHPTATHASGPCLECCDPALRERLATLLAAADVDAAIDVGLTRYRSCPACNARSTAIAAQDRYVLEAQQKLRVAWEARERYRARNARLARRAAERDARRLAASNKSAALPPAAAAILARAKAKAAGKA